MDQQVALWRRTQRLSLIAARQEVSSSDRKAAAEAIAAKLHRILNVLGSTTIGLYWPIKHEINLLAWATVLAQSEHLTLCLPVVVTPKAPIEYWRWTPGERMNAGFWNIPVPIQRDVLSPDLVLAPLVGFDPNKYRLGNGGGYFDRTLASLTPRPIAIGVGYDRGALETIFPQAHDIPMDAIVTEQREILPSHWSVHVA
jgi:5-formyltetrahydrofolate cyclo-ligase